MTENAHAPFLPLPDYIPEESRIALRKQAIFRTHGRLNAYTCEECGRTFYTVDLDEGVTPFTTACRYPCNGLARSHGYRPPRVNEHVAVRWAWIRPRTLTRGMSDELRHYLIRGGLILVPFDLTGLDREHPDQVLTRPGTRR